jgi:predicted N-acetyltransferase YhbS
MKIRKSSADDRKAIDAIHLSAFGPGEGPEIVELVNDLLIDETAKPLLSLVAEEKDKLAGHSLFTVAHLQPGYQEIPAVILAPLAVCSDSQGRGIGGALIIEGLKQLAESGTQLVFVLGHPTYYPRFGFQTAGLLGFEAPYPIPSKNADAWMVRELQTGVLGKTHGLVQCSKTLNQPQYWRE